MESFVGAMPKIVCLILKEGGPTGPPPPGSQAYKIDVGSIRVNPQFSPLGFVWGSSIMKGKLSGTQNTHHWISWSNLNNNFDGAYSVTVCKQRAMAVCWFIKHSLYKCKLPIAMLSQGLIL